MNVFVFSVVIGNVMIIARNFEMILIRNITAELGLESFENHESLKYKIILIKMSGISKNEFLNAKYHAE